MPETASTARPGARRHLAAILTVGRVEQSRTCTRARTDGGLAWLGTRSLTVGSFSAGAAFWATAGEVTARARDSAGITALEDRTRRRYARTGDRSRVLQVARSIRNGRTQR